MPDRDAARRRLETASGLAHRPLTALEDRLAGGGDDPAARRCGRSHRERAMAEARGACASARPTPACCGAIPSRCARSLGLALLVGIDRCRRRLGRTGSARA